jgi:putative ABC transport system permease protein
MGLFQIAFKNIKRNFYNYFLYFGSMVFSIMIYFTFTTIQYNTQVQNIVGSDTKFSIVFKSATIVIALFVSIFIWYSNSFFIRKRKKEVALYSLLGIRKKQIGRMLFYENIVMGLAALIAGILLGGLLSKLLINLLVRLMGFSDYIEFMIPSNAVLNTAIVFTIIFLVTSVHGYSLIYRYKLIELFKAENQGDRTPKNSVIRSIVSVLLICVGYWVYTRPVSVFSFFAIFITLGLTVIGTFMLFSSLTVFIINVSKRNKRRYFNGINMIRISQLLYRIKSNAKSLATIAILSATTLTAIEVSASLYYTLSVNLKENYGFMYAYASNEKGLDKKVEAIIAKYPKNKLIDSVDMNFAKVNGIWPELFKGTTSDQSYQANFNIISESNYNEIARARGLKDKIILNNTNEAVVFGKITNFTSEYDYSGKTISITENNNQFTMKVVDIKPYSLANSGMMRYAVVVKDDVFKQYHTNENSYRIKGYITDYKKDSKELTEEITNLLTKKLTPDENNAVPFSIYYLEYRSGLLLAGMTIFIGAFLGLLFLVATGSIIFFKQLSEANDDKSRYEILKKIGVTNKEIKASISKQIFMVFLLPLVIGIMHSMVATTLLSKLLKVDLTLPIIITISAYTIIYMVYYFLTVKSYYKIINPTEYRA